MFRRRLVQRVRNRDDVTPDNRNNEPLDAILRRAMRAEPGPATPECADAESIAAYSERSLAASERERLEAHFADCMRCQLMFADVARADDSARDAMAASEVPWYRRWRIAIPALTAVAAVLVLIAIRRPANEEPQRDQLAAMAKNEASDLKGAELARAPAQAPQVAAPAPATAASSLAMKEARPQALLSREAPQMNRAMPAPAPEEAPVVPAVAPGPRPPAPASGPDASASNMIATNEAKSEPAPQAEARDAYSSQTLHRQAAAQGAQAMPAQAGAVAANAGALGSFSTAERGSLAARTVGGATAETELLGIISAPDRSAIWMIGKNGSVRRRAVDGAMRMQHSGVSTDLVAGSAPSATVCWIVGRSGTIIRTTDGEHWELITAPSKDNLTGISASSASDATITTAGGQSFATSDGGATWRRQ